jgi:hypothetical protein
MAIKGPIESMENGRGPNPIPEEELAIRHHIGLLGLDWTPACIRKGIPSNMPLCFRGGYGIGIPADPGSDETFDWITQENKEGVNFVVSSCAYPYRRDVLGLIEEDPCDLLVVHLWIDGEVIGKDQVLEINERQFRGYGTVLRDGNHFWIVVAIPKLSIADWRTRYLPRLHAFLLGLSKKWNIVHGDNLVLEIDTQSTWPWMAMPLAGTSDHFYDPPRKVKFIQRGSSYQWDWILSEVMKTPASFNQTGMTAGLPFADYMIRSKPLMASDQSFTAESFRNYILQEDRHRFRFCHDEPGRANRGFLELVIFLRLNFHALPDTIMEILRTDWGNSCDARSPFGSYESCVERMIVKVDHYIRRLIIAMDIAKDRMGRPFSCPMPSSLLMAEDIGQPFSSIRDSLASQYGPQIHFAQDDVYAIQPLRGERQIIFIPFPDSKRKSFFLTIPCRILANYDRAIQERGVLLVPATIAENLISELNMVSESGYAVIYFWFYANRYFLIPVPQMSPGSTPRQIDEAFSWARTKHPEIFRLHKKHALNRTRNPAMGNQWRT